MLRFSTRASGREKRMKYSIPNINSGKPDEIEACNAIVATIHVSGVETADSSHQLRLMLIINIAMSSMSTYDSRTVTLLSGLLAINGAMNPPIIAVMASSRRSKTSEIVIMAAVRATSEHIVAKGLISAYMLWAMAIVTKHTANPPPARTDEKLRYESRSRYAMPQRPRPWDRA